MSTYEPHDYQRYARDFLIDHDEAGLFLDMGMGKSVATLTAIKDLAWDIEHVLIIAPKRPAIDTWPEELQKWDHLKGLSYKVAVGTQQERLAAIRRPAFITIINRENVVWLVKQYQKEKWPFDCVVVDELSSFKSPKSQRFRALKKMRPFIKRVIGLTGTPSANGYMDLWAEMFVIDQGKALGTYITRYRDRYFRPGRRNGMIIYDWILRDGAKEEILERIAESCVSMTAKDYLQLPPLNTIIRKVNLTEASMKQYRQMEKDLLLPVNGETIDAVNAAALTGKLLQISSGAVYNADGKAIRLHDDKMEALDSLIEEADGENVIVFYAYRHEADRIKERHPEAVDVREPDAIKNWKAGKIKLMIAHPASAGHGLNLQSGGHIAIWYGLTASLELYQQACKRLHRQGQQKPVMNYVLLSKGTYDEAVYYSILQAKEKSQSAVLDALKARIKEVSHENTA